MSKRSGKSKNNDFGIRRKDTNGNDMAPRSLRDKHFLLRECTPEEQHFTGIISYTDRLNMEEKERQSERYRTRDKKFKEAQERTKQDAS